MSRCFSASFLRYLRQYPDKSTVYITMCLFFIIFLTDLLWQTMVNNSEVHILFWDYLQIFQIPHLSYLSTLFPEFDDLHEMHGFNPLFTAKSHIWFQVSTLDFPTKTIQWHRLFPATTFFSNMPQLVVAFYEVMEQRKPLGLLQPTSAGVLAKEYRWHSMGPWDPWGAGWL
jgi:hypothetical protein